MFAPSWSAKVEYQYYDFGSSRFIAPVVMVPFGSFSNDGAHAEGRAELSLQLGRPGSRAVLTGFESNFMERPVSRRFFALATQKSRQSGKFPDFINLVTRYCRPNSSWG